MLYFFISSSPFHHFIITIKTFSTCTPPILNYRTRCSKTVLIFVFALTKKESCVFDNLKCQNGPIWILRTLCLVFWFVKLCLCLRSVTNNLHKTSILPPGSQKKFNKAAILFCYGVVDYVPGLLVNLWQISTNFDNVKLLKFPFKAKSRKFNNTQALLPGCLNLVECLMLQLFDKLCLGVRNLKFLEKNCVNLKKIGKN